MKAPAVFLMAFQRPDGLYDVFIPARASDRVVVPANVAGERVLVVQNTCDILALIGALVGAAAGLSGRPAPQFIAELKASDAAIRKMRLGGDDGTRARGGDN